ncbi:hypothetical protein QTO34_019177 [Cnephaeus nilssonii]|uniref:Small ribosomal subunit protein mS38 n=1 Tax=Cnephaeus nilssonii TaxID=3371016 RepID=A0AA40LNN7_CNENI|nr:hypothetical protein QTO34_019177 [Eptesicus nilssonii]
MFLARLASQLLRVAPRAGLRGPGPVSGVLGSHVCRPRYSTQPAGPSRVAILPGKGVQLELEEMLVPRKMSISPLESWLTAHYLLPRLDAGVPGTVAPAQAYECPPSQMNRHKYRKLIKRTRFLRRKVREGRLKRKQVLVGPGGVGQGGGECVAHTRSASLLPSQLRFERDLKRIWVKAGLKEAPPGWQTPKIYLRSK